MARETFLEGKVWRESLPQVNPPFGPEAPALKRLVLPQGELAQLYDGEQGLKYLAAIELREGKGRGNHFHKVKAEYVYLLQGELKLVVEDLETSARTGFTVAPGDLVFIQTRVAHVFQVLRPGLALEFSGARFDAGDIHRYALLE